MKKLIATATALTVVAMASPAFALTAEELQVQINALMAQLQALQSQLVTVQGGTGTVSTGACAGVTFTRNLTIGSTGADVKCLQAVLNQSADTQVASSGVGSPGSETTYFGSLTKTAVVKFQNKYASEILTPLGLTAGTGYVGSSTRSKLSTMVGGVSSTPGTTPITGTGLQVSFASSNPASGTVVDGQGLAPLAAFMFVNGDSADAKITSLKFTRVGISPDSTLNNVYLFEGAVRLTDAASVASSMITFNNTAGVFMVPARSSKTIWVLADVDGAVGETVGVSLSSASSVTSTATSTSGNFPLNGNLFNLASGTGLATFVVSDTTTPTSADIDPQDDYTLFQNSVVVGTRSVWLKRIAFRVIGTINKASDVREYELLVDGVKVGSTVSSIDVNDYITFDLSANPLKLETGTRVVKVLADIIGGSNKNVYLSLRSAADVSVTDSQYNVTVKPTKVDTLTSFTVEDAGTQTINSGTLTVTKMTDSPSGNIVNNGANMMMAKFQFKAAGERVKVESLRISATVSKSTVGELRNGAVFANGAQVGSTADIADDSSTPAYTTYNFGSSLIVEPGTLTVVEVRGDVYDSDGTNNLAANDTIRINIEGGDLNNGQGMTSLVTVDAPSADVNANTLTVKEGSLSLAKNTAYASQTAVAPVYSYPLAKFNLTADTSEAVNVTTLQVDLDDVSSYTTNLYVKYGNQTGTTKSTGAATNSWSINYNLQAGQTIAIEVYGDVSNLMTAGNGIASLLVSGTTAGSATAVSTNSGNVLAGQTISFSTGSFAIAADPANPPDRVEYAMATGGLGRQVLVGRFKFTAVNDSYTIRELRAKVGSATISGAITEIILKDGALELQRRPVSDTTNTAAFFTGLNILVPANTNKILTVEMALNPDISADDGNDQQDVLVTLDDVKHATSQGVESTNTATEPTTNNLIVYQSLPMVTRVDVSNPTLANGSQTTFYSFTVKANGGQGIAIKQLKFDVTWSDGTGDSTPNLQTLKFFRGSEDITTLVAILDEDGNNVEGTTGVASLQENDSNIVVAFDTEEGISAGEERTYSLKATPQGFVPVASINGDDGVAIALAGDTAAHNGTDVYVYNPGTGIFQLATAASGTGASAYNFIWSDNSAVEHAYTSLTSTNDWANGYLVLNLPLDGESFRAP